MIKGISIEVLRPSKVLDRFGNEVDGAWTSEAVENVLVSPEATDSMEASRPDGATVALTLHFPKGYSSPLEGCKVRLPSPWEGDYRVIGDPRPFIDANTPTDWHMPVEVEAAHG